MATFNEFSILLNSCQFDIIAVTEMWLQDTKYQRDYVQVKECNTVFKTGTEKVCAVYKLISIEIKVGLSPSKKNCVICMTESPLK